MCDSHLEGHELRVMTNEEWEESRRQWTPEKAQLNKRIAELHWQVREWSRVERIANMHAAKEALGWTILPDGTSAKVLDNGKDLSTYGGVRYEEEDGTIVDTSTRSDQWHRRHRKITSEFAMRVRSKRLAKARSRTRPSAHRRHCEHRPGFTRRASSSSSTSSSDPGDADPPARPVLSFAPAPRTILTFACLTAVERGEVEA